MPRPVVAHAGPAAGRVLAQVDRVREGGVAHRRRHPPRRDALGTGRDEQEQRATRADAGARAVRVVRRRQPQVGRGGVERERDLGQVAVLGQAAQGVDGVGEGADRERPARLRSGTPPHAERHDAGLRPRDDAAREARPAGAGAGRVVLQQLADRRALERLGEQAEREPVLAQAGLQRRGGGHERHGHRQRAGVDRDDRHAVRRRVQGDLLRRPGRPDVRRGERDGIERHAPSSGP